MGGGGELECESIFVAFACIYENKKALDDLVVFTCCGWLVGSLAHRPVNDGFG